MFKKLRNIFRGIKNTEPVLQPIVGIDISHSFVRVVQLEKKRKVWSLVKVSSKVLAKSYDSEDKRNDAIVTQLKNIKLEQKINFDEAAISLPVNSAIVQVVQIPYLEENELNEAADNGSLWDTAISLPGEIAEYSIFWQTIKKDKEKNTLSLLFVASRIDEIEKNCDLVRKAGFDPLVVDVRCFALRNILKTMPEVSDISTQVFLEISGHENYAVCMHEGLPFIYDIYMTEADTKFFIEGNEKIPKEVFERVAAQVRTAMTSCVKQCGIPSLESVQLSSSLPFVKTIFQKLKSELAEYKVELMDPFLHLNITSDLKKILESEKNSSSFAVALGLATRQLDIFGYFKFVAAVSAINLLPNKDQREKKEKKKIETNGLIKKLIIISTLLLGSSFALYIFMATSMYSLNDTFDMQNKAVGAENQLSEKTNQLDELKKWTQTSGLINSRLLDLSYAASLPNVIYVTEIIHKRNKPSLLVFRAKDPAVSGLIIEALSREFENVTLKDIESPSSNNDLNTISINFFIR
jgi:type IV pilus assembly protein PilN